MRSEDQLVTRITRALASGPGASCTALRLGVGDDAAIVASMGRAHWALSCDAFLEDVHFLAKLHPADSVGYKSLVRATSDLVAMGATPRFFLMTLALPATRQGAWLDRFLRGMTQASRRLGMELIGGDTSISPRVSISITVLGDTPPATILTRAGARPGDIIYVAGQLGRAQLGLELVLEGFGRRRRLARLLRQHLYPELEADLGSWLARHRVASAMIDVSDGLSTDLSRLCAASRVGAYVEMDRIPRVEIPGTLLRQLRHLRLDPLRMALHGGEDYTLLFTVSRSKLRQLRGAPGFSRLTSIGEIARAKQVRLVTSDGRSKPLVPAGWDPFRTR